MLCCSKDESAWKHLKYIELKNLCCQSLSDLRVELRRAKRASDTKVHDPLLHSRVRGLGSNVEISIPYEKATSQI